MPSISVPPSSADMCSLPSESAGLPRLTAAMPAPPLRAVHVTGLSSAAASSASTGTQPPSARVRRPAAPAGADARPPRETRPRDRNPVALCKLREDRSVGARVHPCLQRRHAGALVERDELGGPLVPVVAVRGALRKRRG